MLTTGKTYLAPELEENIQNRLSRIEGHVRGVKCMLDEHQDCENILIQLAAIKSALNQVIIKVLEGHMETCVIDRVVEGEGQKRWNVCRARFRWCSRGHESYVV